MFFLIFLSSELCYFSWKLLWFRSSFLLITLLVIPKSNNNCWKFQLILWISALFNFWGFPWHLFRIVRRSSRQSCFRLGLYKIVHSALEKVLIKTFYFVSKLTPKKTEECFNWATLFDVKSKYEPIFLCGILSIEDVLK